MRALTYHSRELPVMLSDVMEPVPGENQILLEMLYSGLNHREVWMTKGLYPHLKPGVVLGSDGVGRWHDRVYLVNPNVQWGPDHLLPDDGYTILGMPENGCFAEKMGVAKNRLVEIPPHLSPAQAAALPLAGLTAYRVLITRCQVSATDRVCITGIGGGVALFIMQFALALGAEVWVTSSSEEKIQKAIALGAAGGQLYTEEAWHKSLQKASGGFDVLIDSAGGPGFSQLISMAKKGARIGIYGGAKGPIQNLSPQIIFWKHLNIFGSTMGSDQDFMEMVKLVDRYKIVPVIDSVYALDDFQKAFDRMDQGQQFGKIVFENQT